MQKVTDLGKCGNYVSHIVRSYQIGKKYKLSILRVMSQIELEVNCKRNDTTVFIV